MFMNNDNTLPESFDGVFRFTNFTESEFKAKWNGVEYTFPPLSTVPLIIPTATPQEVQSIRKLFARKLAEAVFYQSDKFKSMDLTIEESQAGKVPALYTDEMLAPYIQRCLEALPESRATALPAVEESPSLRTDEKGKPVTKIVFDGESLVGNGEVVA